jgi:hypothetical protein
MKCSINKVKLSSFDSILRNKNSNINVKDWNINMTSSIYNVKFENNYIGNNDINIKDGSDSMVCDGFLYTCICIYIYICMYLYTYKHINKYVYIYMYIYINAYTGMLHSRVY